jgi:hypothetical protein
MAVVHLNESVGDWLGWMGLAGSNEFGPVLLETAGYPGDKATKGAGGIEVSGMWATSCEVSDSNSTDSITQVSCDVNHGQSGSPMWQHMVGESESGVQPSSTTKGAFAGDNGDVFLRGIVSHDRNESCTAVCANDPNSCCGTFVTRNYAAQLTRSAARDVLSWAETKVEAPQSTGGDSFQPASIPSA